MKNFKSEHFYVQVKTPSDLSQRICQPSHGFQISFEIAQIE